MKIMSGFVIDPTAKLIQVSVPNIFDILPVLDQRRRSNPTTTSTGDLPSENNFIAWVILNFDLTVNLLANP